MKWSHKISRRKEVCGYGTGLDGISNTIFSAIYKRRMNSFLSNRKEIDGYQRNWNEYIKYL